MRLNAAGFLIPFFACVFLLCAGVLADAQTFNGTAGFVESPSGARGADANVSGSASNSAPPQGTEVSSGETGDSKCPAGSSCYEEKRTAKEDGVKVIKSVTCKTSKDPAVQKRCKENEEKLNNQKRTCVVDDGDPNKCREFKVGVVTEKACKIDAGGKLEDCKDPNETTYECPTFSQTNSAYKRYTQEACTTEGGGGAGGAATPGAAGTPRSTPTPEELAEADKATTNEGAQQRTWGDYLGQLFGMNPATAAPTASGAEEGAETLGSGASGAEADADTAAPITPPAGIVLGDAESLGFRSPAAGTDAAPPPAFEPGQSIASRPALADQLFGAGVQPTANTNSIQLSTFNDVTTGENGGLAFSPNAESSPGLSAPAGTAVTDLSPQQFAQLQPTRPDIATDISNGNFAQAAFKLGVQNTVNSARAVADAFGEGGIASQIARGELPGIWQSAPQGGAIASEAERSFIPERNPVFAGTASDIESEVAQVLTNRANLQDSFAALQATRASIVNGGANQRWSFGENGPQNLTRNEALALVDEAILDTYNDDFTQGLLQEQIPIDLENYERAVADAEAAVSAAQDTAAYEQAFNQSMFDNYNGPMLLQEGLREQNDLYTDRIAELRAENDAMSFNERYFGETGDQYNENTRSIKRLEAAIENNERLGRFFQQNETHGPQIADTLLGRTSNFDDPVQQREANKLLQAYASAYQAEVENAENLDALHNDSAMRDPLLVSGPTINPNFGKLEASFDGLLGNAPMNPEAQQGLDFLVQRYGPDIAFSEDFLGATRQGISRAVNATLEAMQPETPATAFEQATAFVQGVFTSGIKTTLAPLTQDYALRAAEYSTAGEFARNIANPILGPLEIATFVNPSRALVNAALGRSTSFVDTAGSAVSGRSFAAADFVDNVADLPSGAQRLAEAYARSANAQVANISDPVVRAATARRTFDDLVSASNAIDPAFASAQAQIREARGVVSGATAPVTGSVIIPPAPAAAAPVRTAAGATSATTPPPVPTASSVAAGTARQPYVISGTPTTGVLPTSRSLTTTGAAAPTQYASLVNEPYIGALDGALQQADTLADFNRGIADIFGNPSAASAEATNLGRLINNAINGAPPPPLPTQSPSVVSTASTAADTALPSYGDLIASINRGEFAAPLAGDADIAGGMSLGERLRAIDNALQEPVPVFANTTPALREVPFDDLLGRAPTSLPRNADPAILFENSNAQFTTLSEAADTLNDVRLTARNRINAVAVEEIGDAARLAAVGDTAGAVSARVEDAIRRTVAGTPERAEVLARVAATNDDVRAVQELFDTTSARRLSTNDITALESRVNNIARQLDVTPTVADATPVLPSTLTGAGAADDLPSIVRRPQQVTSNPVPDTAPSAVSLEQRRITLGDRLRAARSAFGEGRSGSALNSGVAYQLERAMDAFFNPTAVPEGLGTGQGGAVARAANTADDAIAAADTQLKNWYAANNLPEPEIVRPPLPDTPVPTNNQFVDWYHQATVDLNKAIVRDGFGTDNAAREAARDALRQSDLPLYVHQETSSLLRHNSAVSSPLESTRRLIGLTQDVEEFSDIAALAKRAGEKFSVPSRDAYQALDGAGREAIALQNRSILSDLRDVVSGQKNIDDVLARINDLPDNPYSSIRIGRPVVRSEIGDTQAVAGMVAASEKNTQAVEIANRAVEQSGLLLQRLRAEGLREIPIRANPDDVAAFAQLEELGGLSDDLVKTLREIESAAPGALERAQAAVGIDSVVQRINLAVDAVTSVKPPVGPLQGFVGTELRKEVAQQIANNSHTHAKHWADAGVSKAQLADRIERTIETNTAKYYSPDSKGLQHVYYDPDTEMVVVYDKRAGSEGGTAFINNQPPLKGVAGGAQRNAVAESIVAREGNDMLASGAWPRVTQKDGLKNYIAASIAKGDTVTLPDGRRLFVDPKRNVVVDYHPGNIDASQAYSFPSTTAREAGVVALQEGRAVAPQVTDPAAKVVNGGGGGFSRLPGKYGGDVNFAPFDELGSRGSLRDAMRNAERTDPFARASIDDALDAPLGASAADEPLPRVLRDAGPIRAESSSTGSLVGRLRALSKGGADDVLTGSAIAGRDPVVDEFVRMRTMLDEQFDDLPASGAFATKFDNKLEELARYTYDEATRKLDSAIAGNSADTAVAVRETVARTQNELKNIKRAMERTVLRSDDVDLGADVVAVSNATPRVLRNAEIGNVTPLPEGSGLPAIRSTEDTAGASAAGGAGNTSPPPLGEVAAGGGFSAGGASTARTPANSSSWWGLPAQVAAWTTALIAPAGISAPDISSDFSSTEAVEVTSGQTIRATSGTGIIVAETPAADTAARSNEVATNEVADTPNDARTVVAQADSPAVAATRAEEVVAARAEEVADQPPLQQVTAFEGTIFEPPVLAECTTEACYEDDVRHLSEKYTTLVERFKLNPNDADIADMLERTEPVLTDARLRLQEYRDAIDARRFAEVDDVPEPSTYTGPVARSSGAAADAPAEPPAARDVATATGGGSSNYTGPTTPGSNTGLGAGAGAGGGAGASGSGGIGDIAGLGAGGGAGGGAGAPTAPINGVSGPTSPISTGSVAGGAAPVPATTGTVAAQQPVPTTLRATSTAQNIFDPKENSFAWANEAGEKTADGTGYLSCTRRSNTIYSVEWNCAEGTYSTATGFSTDRALQGQTQVFVNQNQAPQLSCVDASNNPVATYSCDTSSAAGTQYAQLQQSMSSFLGI